MKVKFFDLEREDRPVKSKISKAIARVVKSTEFILGEEVDAFEMEFKRFLDVKHVVTCASGTDALLLSMMALNIKEGDEVIIPAFTFVATAFAVSYSGAKPVLVDVDPLTHSIDVKKMEKAITRKTRAIIPVHLYGNPAEMDSILRIAKKHKLFIVEDAAQAHGAEYKRKKVGTIGKLGCFSFYPSKNLGAYGDGGAIATNDNKLAEKLRMLRNYGQRVKYFSEKQGLNSRLDSIQAAILRIKLKNIGKRNRKRREIARLYKDSLIGLNLEIPSGTKYASPCYYIFPILVKNRDGVMKRLAEKGIETLIHYPVPIHLQEAYRDLGYKKKDFPISEKIANTTMSIPMYSFLSKKEVEYVAKIIKETL